MAKPKTTTTTTRRAVLSGAAVAIPSASAALAVGMNNAEAARADDSKPATAAPAPRTNDSVPHTIE